MPRVPNLPSISPGSSSVFVGDDGTSTGAFSRNSVCADVIENYSGSTLAGSAQSVKAAINGLNSKISALSTSTTAAPTAAAMTDTSKIYVYTGSETGYTNGNWYYYDGSAWVSGGAFNAAGCDDALSDTSTNAVQNKVVNGAIDDLKSALNNVALIKNVATAETYKWNWEKDGNNLLLSVVEQLNNIAYNGKTYQEIFIDTNIVPWGDFEHGLDDVTSKTNNPTITDDTCVSPTHSLKCFGSASVQVRKRLTLTVGHVYMLAVSVKCDRRTAGSIGSQITFLQSSTYNCSKSAVTNGWDSSVITFTAPVATCDLYAGSYNSANIDGYIDDLCLIDLTELFGESVPSESQLKTLYMALQNIYRNVGTSYIIYDKVTYSASDCLSAFIDAMQSKADNLGMEHTTITSPSGADTNNVSTAKDLIKMLTVATSYNRLCHVWNKKEHDIVVKGSNARSISIDTGVTDATFENAYYILGGKTGSWQISSNPTTYMNNLAVCACNSDGVAVVGVIMHATTSAVRFSAMKELFDIAFDAINGENVENKSVTNAECAIAWRLPNFNTAMCEGYVPEILFSQNETIVYATASVIKILSVITALDYINMDDINKYYTMTSEDIVDGSGAIFQSGDKVKVIDLIYAMMLPSSNQAAMALAHYVGNIILQSKD